MRPIDVPSQYRALHALRGIAACIVVIHHCGPGGWIAGSAFIVQAWIVVDFFFVMSGFIIAARYWDRLAAGLPLRVFMVRRAARLMPLHLAVLIAWIGFELMRVIIGMAEPQRFSAGSLGDLAATALMVQIFGATGVGTWNPPSWSIAAEFWVYGLAGLAMAAGRRLTIAPLIALILAMGVVLGMAERPLLEPAPWRSIVRCAYAFALGALVWRLTGGQAIGALAARPAIAEALAIAAMGLAIAISDIDRWALAGPPLFALAVALLANDPGRLSRGLAVPPLLRLGTLAYALYLVHYLVVTVVLGVAAGIASGPPDRLMKDGWMVLALAVSILAAMVVHRWVEAPARAAINAWAARGADRIPAAMR